MRWLRCLCLFCVSSVAVSAISPPPKKNSFRFGLLDLSAASLPRLDARGRKNKTTLVCPICYNDVSRPYFSLL